MRVCAEPGCPALVKADAYRGRCTEHKRQYNRQWGTTTNRGYGHQHQQLRAQWQRRINTGQPVTCWRCGARVRGTDWHLDHTSDRSGYRGPACRECNLHLAARARHGLPPD